MTLAAAKEKLHEIIERADEEKVFELLLLLEREAGGKGYVYDEETLKMLRERSEDYLSGKSKTYSIDESMEHIRKHRKGNGA